MIAEPTELIKIGDIVSIHSEIKGNSFIISSKSYIPSFATLSPFTNIQPYQSFFRIQRPKLMTVEEYPNPDDDVKNYKSEGQNEKQEIINFDEPVIFIHLLSGRYLTAKQSDGQHINLIVSEDYQRECEFKLMPMFRCQTLGSKRVRQGEEVVLRSLSFEDNQGNYNLAVTGGGDKVSSIGTKADVFSVKVNKRGLLDNQNQLYYRKLYKINNIQIDRNIIITKNIVTFFQAPNEFETMFYFLKIRDVNSFTPIQQNQGIYLKSVRHDLFIELHGGEFRATEKCIKSCQFKLLEYRISSPHVLTKQSVLTLVHIESGRYLSFEFQHQKGDFISKPSSKFDLKDTVQLIPVQDSSIRQCFFISQFKSFLEKFAEMNFQKSDISNDLFQLKNVLFEMLIFLFNQTKIGCENVIIKFFELETMKTCTTQNHTLFKEWNIGSAIFKTIQTVVHDYRRLTAQMKVVSQGKKSKKPLEKDDILERIQLDSNIIKIMYVLIVGMCKNNFKNTKLFLKFNSCVFSHIDLDLGGIECIIHIFKDNKEFLRLLQGAPESGSEKSYMHLILSHVKRIPKSKISIAIKIAELLKCLVISNSQAVKMNQTIVGEEFSVNKLEQTLFSRMECDDGELKIFMFEDPEEQQQVIEMYIKKNKYSTELILVEKLLTLYASLCAGRNYLNVEFFRQKLPLKTILRYINNYSIQGSLKNCFLTILLHTYLDSLPRTLHTQNNIICIEQGRKQTTYESQQITDRLLNKDSTMEVEMKQVSSYRYDTQLNDIREQLMKDIMHQLSTSKFTESTYMIMEILYSYLTFNMFSQEDRSQLKLALTEFICSDAKIIGQSREKIYFTTIKILHKFQEYSEEQNSKSVVLQLLANPRKISDIDELFESVILKRRYQESQNNKLLSVLFAFCQQFKQGNNASFVDLALDTIKKRMLPKRGLVKHLKSILIIQQPQILTIYNKIKNDIMIDLQLQIQKLSISLIRMDKSLMYESVRKLNQGIEDIIMRFTHDDEEFNKRYQYMLKELGIHKIILSFLIQSINDLKLDILTDTAKVYKSAFKFLAHFVDKNQTNIKIIVRSINDLKKYILFPEMGQSHFFLMLTKIEDIKFMIEESIVPTVLQNLPNNIYLTCIMLEYCKKENIINTKFIDKLSKRFLSDESLFASILMMKKSRGTTDLALGQRKITQLIYYTQLFRLLNMMFEYTTDKKYLIQMSKRYITLEILLRALNHNDIFEERTDRALVYTLLQKELIRCIRLLKLNEMIYKKQNEDLIEVLFQKSLKKVHFYNQETENDQNNYINGFMQNQLTQVFDILLMTQDFKNNSSNFDKSIHFVYYLTSLLGPLIGDMLSRYLENETGQLNELSKKQMQILQDNFSKKIKEAVYDLLTKYDYDKYTTEFSKAISRCEEIFKIKIKLGFTGIRERKETLLAEEDTDEVIKNTRLELVLHFFAQGSDKERKLYKSIFDIMQGQEAINIIKEERQKLSKLIIDTLKDSSGMIDLLSSIYIEKLSKGDFDKLQQRKSLCNVIMFIRLILHNSEAKQIQLMFINNKIAEATIKWCSESSCDAQIHSRVLVLLSQLLVSNNVENGQCQDKVISILKQMQPTNQFFEKLKVILKDEKLIYSNLIFSEKRRDRITSQKPLSYEHNAQQPGSLNLVLTFLQSLIQGSHTSNKQYVGTQLGFLQILISLLRCIIKYSLSFSQNYKVYYSLSSHSHISSILETMHHFINYQPTTNIQILIERNLIGTFMDILSMNDHIKHQETTYSRSAFERLEELMLNCPVESEKKYLRQVYAISKASLKLYKELPKFVNPFLPTQPNYLRVKTAVIKTLSELIHLQNKHQQTIIFKSLSESTIKTNIMNIYSKHLIIYNKTYEIFAFYNKARIYNDPQVAKISFKQLVQDSNYIENGFMLVYILRKTQSHREQIDKQIQQLRRKKVSNRTYMEPIREVIDFGKDVGTLVKGCFRCFNTVDTKVSEEDEGIVNAIRFFLEKSGRIEILKNQTLYAIDFPRLPECVRKIELQTEYLDEIDLTSVQSKSDSILKYSSRFILLYDNEERYKVQYKSLPFIDILLQHMNLFRNISFIIIIILNLLILINKRQDINSPNYTKQFKLFYAFIVLQMCISYVLFLFFLLKQMPLIILQINTAIEVRRNTYGSNFNTYPLLVRFSIRVWMFIAQPQLLYHLLFTISVTVSFFYPVFVSVLLLDIFIRIPLLRRILMAIWRPKVEIILALVAFILIQYYFSILLYFSFQDQTFGFCNNLQDCFSFVYYVTYKVVGGFPGYLFQYKQDGQTNFQVSGFSIFEDIYIIITFEIFFAVLIGIIIDNFTILRTEQDEKRNHLENYCLICGVNKAVINQSNTKTNFRKHIREDHNVWSYFYFFTYIHKKQRHQRTELQEYMANCLQNKSTEWLPLNYMSHLKLKS